MTATSPVALLVNDAAGARRPPQIVVIGGQKGGTGKTTIGMLLVLMAVLSGLKVLAVDADRANGMSDVFSRRRNNDELPVKINCIQKVVPSGQERRKGAKAFAREILALADDNDYDLIVIDTAGFDATDQKNLELRGALLVADLLLIVSRPGHLDRRVLPEVWTMALEARDIRAETAGDEEPDPLDVVCVLNAVPTNPFQRDRDVREAMKMLLEDVPDLPIADKSVANRSIYYRGLMEGVLALDQKPNAKERTELMALYETVLQRQFKRETHEMQGAA